MNRRTIWIIAILLLAAIGFFFITKAQHREDLGQLTVAQHAQGNTYCVYRITRATPDAGRYYNDGDKVCVECCGTWPDSVGVNQICPSRIKFIASSGLVTYEAEAWDVAHICDGCADGLGHYKCP